MIEEQDCKWVNVLVPASATDGATTTGYVDTIGFDYCEMIWHIATGADTSDMPEKCYIEESEDLTTYTAIVPLTGGTATSTSVGFVIPPSHATVEQLYSMNIDLRGRKRYLKCTLVPETTNINFIVARLSRPKVMPDTTTEAGVALLVNT